MIIQWYPGHMTKTKRMMEKNISLVDIVIELLDARIPFSSKNPDIDTLANNKLRIIVLNKADLACDEITGQWHSYFERKEFRVVVVDCLSGSGINKIVETARELMKDKIERLKSKGRIFVPIRAMIVGIPNVGKSTLINKYVGKYAAKTGDKPGITRDKQWIKIKKDFELLDTPGILWPKFEDQDAALKLAFTGAIKDNIMDTYTLSLHLIECLLKISPSSIEKRYNIKFDLNKPAYKILEQIGNARGFKEKGGCVDIERTAVTLLDEFRGSKLGKISLEVPKNQ